MELINQHTKKIMEDCKERARDAGLSFDNETLEYIVTNRNMIELSPKLMIPTLYDYWVHDVEVLKEKGRYELYPGNPYETVINTRPAISFYNDNNPDWLNVMIFYHVLAHIDFFQNNVFFEHTWDYDFTGQALSDKRMIARLRSQKGHWVDYIIEFARGIDNLVGYFPELTAGGLRASKRSESRLDYYFDVFLQQVRPARPNDYLKEVERYNECVREFGEHASQGFFADVSRQYPEFETLYDQWRLKPPTRALDLLQYLMDHSPFLQAKENRWMNSIMAVVRKTSLFFQPQIRTKIMNEGWASYWHEKLFLADERIAGHEVDFAIVNANVTAMPRVGLNPYALGMRLFNYIEEQADRGRFSYEFQRLQSSEARRGYDLTTKSGREFIFHVRRHFADFIFINRFLDQDFVDSNRLFVSGKRLNKERMVWEYYVKSRSADAYRDMLREALYHPPAITVDESRTDRALYLVHRFEGKPLVRDFIANTMMGIEFLWGGPVRLETWDVAPTESQGTPFMFGAGTSDTDSGRIDIRFVRVLYTMENKKLIRTVIEEG